MIDRRVGRALGLVAALAGILVGYYYVHKPVTPAQALALASALADLAVAGLLGLIGGGLGRRLVRAQEIASPGERVIVHAVLGEGMMGLAMLALGMAGLYFSPLIWALAALAAIFLWREERDWLADLVATARAMWSPDRLAQLACLFVLFTLALGLLRALAPPTMWDALTYHLTLPKLYAESHSVQIKADILFTGMPQLAEMLYTAATLMRGEIAPQVLGWMWGAMLALGLAACASEWLDARRAALSPAILFSSPTMALLLAWAYSDLLLLLATLATLIALRQWRLSGALRWLVLSGILAGLVVSCKYTSALVPLAGASVIALECLGRWPWDGQRLQAGARQVALFGGAALFAFAPWLIKNVILTGSPTYPLLIPVGYMDAVRQWFYTRPDLSERNPLSAALIFLRATFLGVQGANSYDATLGPLFVFLLLGLAVGGRKLAPRLRVEVRPLAIFALVGYAGWVMLVLLSGLAWQVRLFFALFPALALLGAAGVMAVASFDAPTLRVSVIANAALVLVLSLSAVENLAAFAVRSPLAYLVGAQSETDYRVASLGMYVAAIDRVNVLPAGSRVEFLWETRSLECAASVRCEPDVVIDRWWHLRRTVGAASEIVSGWKAKGVTHVLINESGLDFVRSQADAAFMDSDWSELDVLRGQMRLVQDLNGAYSLYELP